MDLMAESVVHDGAGAEKRRVALWSVLAAVLLTGTKLLVGVWTGSLGILAEAAHSGLDLVAAVITFAAVRVSDKPPDSSHPYGHGKVENLSALAETLLLLITCAWIVQEAINRLFFETVHIDASVWAFAVMGVSIFVDINRSRVLKRVAEKHDSQALEADALHFSTDIWSSAVVIGGLAVVRLNEWLGGPPALAQADAVAALVVAMIVIYVSLQLGKRSVDVLLDAAPKGLGEKIRAQVEKIDGVGSCRQVRVRRSGAESFVDLVLEIDGDASFDVAHETTAMVEGVVAELVPRADVVVHYEPDALSSDLASLVRRTAERMGARAHDIWVRRSDGQIHIELHLEVERDASLEHAHELATKLEHEVKEAAPAVAAVVVHLEPVGDTASAGARPEHGDSAALERRIASLVDGFVEVGACHQVELWEEEAGLAASLHCSLRGELSVEEAHDLSERLEAHLRRQMPEFRRVVIHLEPVP
jgi:cation diffusion facilitator family transporter